MVTGKARRGRAPALTSSIVVVLALTAGGLRADEASPDSEAASDPPASAPAVVGAEPDSVAAEPPWFPDPTRADLRTFRVDRSVDVQRIRFGDPADPSIPPGLQTLADLLRLQPSTHTRELSQGPTVESFGLDGGGAGRAALRLRGRPLSVPGTSAPHSHEVMLNELDSVYIVRGGAAALYGTDAVSGAVLARPAHPVPEELTTRAIAEEGVDEYQRAGFQLAQRLGAGASVYLSTESRRTDGFFPGTKEVDRNFAATVQARLPRGLEMATGYRRYEGDGRHGDFESPRSVLTKRGDYHLELFRPSEEGRGSLLEVNVVRERLETEVESVDASTREILSPSWRVTTDLPEWRGWEWVARAEATRWRIEWEELDSVSRFWRAAGALRASRDLGNGRRLTGTARVDGESHRKRALQARLEGEWSRGPATGFAVYSRGERIPDRGASGIDNEVHDTGTVGLHWNAAALRIRAAAFGTKVRDFRRDATFEEIRAREPVLDAPVGDATITGTSLGLETDAFEVPGVRFLGHWQIASSVTQLHAENDDTGERLPGRPRFTWTGEGHLQRRFFEDELLARVRGRLTHWGDRVDDAGAPVTNLWMTDVLLEGEIGDATFFFRFHDMLERADEVEPGIRFPGFSRTYGISWRFVG